MKQFGWKKIFLCVLLGAHSGAAIFGGQQDAHAAVYVQQKEKEDSTLTLLSQLRNDRDKESSRMFKLYICDQIKQGIEKKHNNVAPTEHQSDYQLYTQVDTYITSLTSNDLSTILWNEFKERSLNGFGQVVEGHVAKAVDKTLGKGIDSAVDGLVSFMNKAWYVMVADNQRPFTGKVIDGWKGLVDGAFDDINHMHSDELRAHSRAADPVLRQGDDQTPETAVVVNGVWKELIGCYAEQFDYLASQMDRHKKYYDRRDDALIIFYAEQIKKQLLKWRAVLLKANSLSELDALVDSSKTMIPAMRNGLIKLFELLKDQIPVDASGGSSSSSQSSRPKNDRPTYGFGGMGMDREREF